jgi:hypothetical protein
MLLDRNDCIRACVAVALLGLGIIVAFANLFEPSKVKLSAATVRAVVIPADAGAPRAEMAMLVEGPDKNHDAAKSANSMSH